MISQKSIQEIIETAKVEDVVSDFVSLKRRGVNMIGNCPFHNEKTPSFTVSPQKNIYKCFGCGQAGNPVSFVMEHEGFSYPEALRYLAKKYGIQLEETGNREENLKERQLIDSLYIVNDFAKTFYEKQLLETDLGRSIGLSYFKERGFREESIKKFELGYAPEKGDSLTVAAVHQQYNIDILRKVGLANQYRKDFFRGRVMFPIRNLSGKVIGFGGRILDSRKKTAKYMNTPETEIYNKSKVLFGIYHAKKAIRQLDNCILVEGYTDVISLSQSGIENVVASSGTSLTQGQIALIKRYTPNITILYDGDAAGVKAALRGLDLVLEQGLNVKVVLLPDGEDPDSYVQKMGTTAFKEYLEKQSQDFILFKTSLMLKETANDPIKKAGLIKNIVSSIARIPDPIKRSVYIRECAGLMDMNEEVLINETNKIVHGLVKKSVQENAPQPEEPIGEKVPVQTPSKVAKVDNNEFQEKDIVKNLIEDGTEIIEEGITVADFILTDMQELFTDFKNPIYRKFIDIYYKSYLSGHILTAQELSNSTDIDIRNMVINLRSSKYELSENWEKRHGILIESRANMQKFNKKKVVNGVNHFKLKKVKKIKKEVQEKLPFLKHDEKELYKQIKIIKELTKLEERLSKLTGTVVGSNWGGRLQ